MFYMKTVNNKRNKNGRNTCVCGFYPSNGNIITKLH